MKKRPLILQGTNIWQLHSTPVAWNCCCLKNTPRNSRPSDDANEDLPLLNGPQAWHSIWCADCFSGFSSLVVNIYCIWMIMNVYYVYYTGILWYTKKHRISWEKTQIMFTSCSKGVCCHVTNAIFPRNYLFQNILVSIYQYLKLLKKNTCSWICRTARKKTKPICS